MGFSAAVFDLDGTLLDTLDDITDAVNFTLRYFGKPEVTRDQVRRYTGYGAAFLIRSASKAEDAELEKMLPFYCNYYYDHVNIKTAPYPGTVELISNLSSNGVKCSVVSNKPDAAVKSLMSIHFPDVFDFIAGGRSDLKLKPEPDGIIMAVKTSGCSIDEAVFVGDSESDIKAAGNAGLPVISVLWGFRKREDLEGLSPNYFASDVKELEKIILGRA